jgi:hypothetical protein
MRNQLSTTHGRLAREINSDSGEGSFHGVFVSGGPEPTANELAEAEG